MAIKYPVEVEVAPGLVVRAYPRKGARNVLIIDIEGGRETDPDNDKVAVYFNDAVADWIGPNEARYDRLAKRG